MGGQGMIHDMLTRYYSVDILFVHLFIHPALLQQTCFSIIQKNSIFNKYGDYICYFCI